MKSTDHFKRTIQAYLEQRASEDRLFAEAYRKDGKNIDDCVTYMLNTVKASGCNGFTDGEVYSMAVHYYPKYIVIRSQRRLCIIIRWQSILLVIRISR